MSPRHLTDEELISKLDGELGLLAASSVQQHLQVCWPCRARMRELEDQALQIARQVSNDSFPGPSRVAFAMQKFSAWRAQGPGPESLRSFAPASSNSRFDRPRGFVWGVAFAVGLGLACVVFLSVHHPVPHVVSAPAPVLAQAVALSVQRAESAWINQPYHENLRIEIRLDDSPSPLRSHLEIWSDQPGRRIAVEWRDGAGRLRSAHWKPDAHRSYYLDPATRNVVTVSPAVSAERAPFVSLTAIELTGSSRDLRQLEAQLLRYVKGQSLRPVSLSETFAEFAGSNGLTVRLEKAQTPDSMLRLRASRESGGITADLVLEVDASTLQVRTLTLRLHNARHSLQAAFIVEKFETLRRSQLYPATFEPKAARPVIAPPAPMEAEERPNAGQDFGEKEIDIHFALHRIRACMGDPIRVERLESGRIVVRGLVESDAQKDRILAVLRDFGGVDGDITTVAEAVRERPAPSVHLLPAQPIPLQIDNASFRMRAKLETYFSGLIDAHDHANAIAQLSNQAISLSGSALAEAWAIRRLRRTFPVGHPDPLGLIDQMLADHAAAFRARAGELRTLLQPFLPASSTVAPLTAPDPLTAAQSLDDLIRSMFSGSQAPDASLESDLQRLSGLLAAANHVAFTEREP